MTTDNEWMEGVEDDTVPPYIEKDAGAPRWLMWSYLLVPLWGIITFILFWNGSWGWLDRGSWKELQEAARTTYPQDQQKP